MATLRELIYKVKNPPNGGMSNRANELGDRLIAAWIQKYANMLISQQVTKDKRVDQSFEFSLGCLTLTKADAAMCSEYNFCEPVYYVCLPPLLDLEDNMALTFFGLIDGQTRIPISDYSYGGYSTYNRFSPKRIYGEMYGNKVVLRGIDPIFPLEAVTARGVWSNVVNLTTDCDPDTPLKCFDWDKSVFPFPASLEGNLMELIYTRELGIVRNSITDRKADDVSEEKP